jgi:integrase
MSSAERDRIVISAVVDEDGKEHVVSRFGDPVWDYTAGVWPPNTAAWNKKVHWANFFSKEFLIDAKTVFYLWSKRGRKGFPPPVPSSVVGMARDAGPLVAHLLAKGLRSFAEVTALHLSDYAAEYGKTVVPVSVSRRLYVVDLAWHFRKEVMYPLPHHPWAGQSFFAACGVKKSQGGWNGEAPSGLTATTPVIPPSVQVALFRHAEAHLSRAEESFQRRDRGKSATSFALIALRDSIAYLVAVSTGMRHSDLAGIKSGCWRPELRNGSVFHWIRTVEHKTKKGPVDFLAPAEAIEALKVLEKYAVPLQRRLSAEIRWLEEQLVLCPAAEVLPSGMTRVTALQRLLVARSTENSLFLGETKYGADHTGSGRIEVLSNTGFGAAMNRLGRSAGVTWRLAGHQCRRTFAWTVANSQLGRKGLMFLKWQLKHSTMTMTQLYASNPNQDDSLYDEFRAEIAAARCEVLESWFDGEIPLSGGAGKRISKARATPVSNLGSLLKLTAESVTIRSTGHSWCLAERGACVGEGIYEAVRCGTCSEAVIDPSHAETWTEIHFHNLELLSLKDCGPAVEQRARRAVAQSLEVLRDLGIEAAANGRVTE